MYKKPVILFVAIYCVIFVSSFGVSGENPSYDYELVAGFYNEITYYGDSGMTEISLTKGNASYYWLFNGSWGGDVEYIDILNSSYQNNQWTVNIGVEAIVDYGDWDMTIDGQHYLVWIGEPNSAIEVYKPDIGIRFDPYKSDEKKSQQALKFVNAGNTILEYEFISSDNNLVVVDRKGVIRPNDEVYASFTYNIESEAPQIRKVPVRLHTEPVNTVSNQTVQLVSSWDYNFDVSVTVGYEGYTVVEGSVVVQHKRFIEVERDSEYTVSFYIDGDGNVPISLVYDGVEILTETEKTPYTAKLDGGEHNYTVVVRTEDRDGYVGIRIDGKTVKTELYMEEIQSNPATSKEEYYVKQEIIGGLVLVAGIVGVMGMIHYIGGRRSEDK